MISPLWTYDLKSAELVRIRKGRHWMPHSRFKDYNESVSGRARQLEDHMVFHNTTDAAIALTAMLVAMAKKRLNEATALNKSVLALAEKYDIGDCPYLAPLQVP